MPLTCIMYWLNGLQSHRISFKTQMEYFLIFFFFNEWNLIFNGTFVRSPAGYQGRNTWFHKIIQLPSSMFDLDPNYHHGIFTSFHISIFYFFSFFFAFVFLFWINCIPYVVLYNPVAVLKLLICNSSSLQVFKWTKTWKLPILKLKCNMMS